MFILKSILETYCNDRNGRVYACFIDFRKAFDTVIHTGIKIKLLQIGVESKFYNIVKSMYGTSTSCIRLENGVTDSFPVHVGVKQGDSLSPNLFKIFINVLPSYVRNTQDPIKLNDKDIHCLMFADDIVLFSKSQVGLQEKLNKLHDYCKDWCLSVNTSKTKIMVFNKAGKLITHQFMYDGKPLECVKSYKYLGIHFSISHLPLPRVNCIIKHSKHYINSKETSYVLIQVSDLLSMYLIIQLSPYSCIAVKFGDQLISYRHVFQENHLLQ